MKFFKKSLKGILDIVVLPIEIVKDVATLGGSINDKEFSGTYTGDRLRSACENFGDAYDSLDD